MIILNSYDPRPIYEQLMERLRQLILTGSLPAGEKLPSVRELAAELSINPNTIQRAYRELESEGYIYSVPGKGSFAAALSAVSGARREKLLHQFSQITGELLHLGLTRDELLWHIDKEANSND